MSGAHLSPKQEKEIAAAILDDNASDADNLGVSRTTIRRRKKQLKRQRDEGWLWDGPPDE